MSGGVAVCRRLCQPVRLDHAAGAGLAQPLFPSAVVSYDAPTGVRRYGREQTMVGRRLQGDFFGRTFRQIRRGEHTVLAEERPIVPASPLAVDVFMAAAGGIGCIDRDAGGRALGIRFGDSPNGSYWVYKQWRCRGLDERNYSAE